jgi:hypothetical protein
MLVGARQVGKSTLARRLSFDGPVTFFDLEDPTVSAILDQPLLALERLPGLVVIDEAQRAPHLFPVLRVLADRTTVSTKFLLLGSASPELRRQGNESLAGRVEVIDVTGFSADEVGFDHHDALWLRGGFPRSFLAASDEDSMSWRDQFTRTFVERDLGLLGFNFAPTAMGRFWTMLSHYHGQLWNASEIASSMGVSAKTVSRYLDALEATFMVRRLQPWFANVGKRMVKSPKIYVRDSGMLHWQQRIADMRSLLYHPKVGASWEGFVIEQLLAQLPRAQAFFYSVHSGSELDLLLLHDGKRIGVEVKREDAPRFTRSMHVAIEDLSLDYLWVIYPGSRRYTLGTSVEVLPFTELHSVR